MNINDFTQHNLKMQTHAETHTNLLSLSLSLSIHLSFYLSLTIDLPMCLSISPLFTAVIKVVHINTHTRHFSQSTIKIIKKITSYQTTHTTNPHKQTVPKRINPNKPLQTEQGCRKPQLIPYLHTGSLQSEEQQSCHTSQTHTHKQSKAHAKHLFIHTQTTPKQHKLTK